MDRETIDFYMGNAERLCERYETAGDCIARYFPQAFREGSRILDIGAACGRDLAFLVEMGFDAYGVEPVGSFRQEALQRHPHLAGRLLEGALPNLELPDLAPFDGILCSAVFMHLPEQEQFDAAYTIRGLLKPHGRLLITVPRQRGAGEAGVRLIGKREHRDLHGRLFTPITSESLALLFERIGFRLIGQWTDADALHRDGFEWTTSLFDLRDAGGLRPIDKVEGVLNRDRKFATYKLALFRALCDIARTGYRSAQWRPDGMVAIPLDSVANLWIRYYWPLVEQKERFIPQRRGETRGCRKPIAFRPLLDELITEYRGAGGLDRFLADQSRGNLPPSPETITRALIRKLRQTILSGPVQYAGGSLESGRLFGRERGKILLSADIWREICLAGHWIQDALILRWGELTSEISGKEVTVSEAVGLLLTPVSAERDVSAARSIYKNLPEKKCVWTGRRLVRSFDVDHLLPHALWRNNSLWNLLPTSPAVNRMKSDRLPEHTFLLDRQPAITGSWSALQEALPARFSREAAVLVGRDSPSLEELFSAVVEAVEITALQRGCRRWVPKDALP